ncbi:penicillin acylase family protein [Streptomyces sp. KLOTTS4A1]|uniref:penicillin acylase family protein n=1 Tax=Streptomyces sp. KLOTTS4A1 TaxID=3390996 RepID=UPI0039F5A518
MPANTTATSGGRTAGRKKGRRLRLFVIVLAVALVAGLGFGAWWSISTVRASLPQVKGSLTLDGLSAPVDVRRDAQGIPQIYADTAEDLFRAQGYVQAQDRFWEMDVRRHLTSGRLSEMFGKGQVDTDAFLRTLGWRRVAQQEYDEELSAETKKYLQAYAEGVNAYLDVEDGKARKSGEDISVEYAALGFTTDYEIEEWTPVDSVAWLKAMAWDLRGNMQDEIDRSLMYSRLGPKQIAELYPGYPYKTHEPIVQEGAVDGATDTYEPKASATRGQAGSGSANGLQSGETGAALGTQLAGLSKVLENMPDALGPNGNGIGSNSWVVSGKHTTSGKPLLANDPHLAPMLPSLWYQMGLHCRSISEKCQYDVSGYTFSGMPGVIIGHNQEIAWGMTNLGADVTDLYLEKIQGDGYLRDGKVQPFETRKETIEVAGGRSRSITVRETDNGPLVSDRSEELRDVGEEAPVESAAPDRADGYAIALRWTALDPGRSMDAVFSLNRATDFKQFRAAAALFEVPSQNLIYADREGNIGYQAPGRIPTRAEGHDGTLPAPGWDSGYDWTGFIPQKALPYEYNPKRGYIVTANQAVVDESYPYPMTRDWGYGARSQRINDLIESKIEGRGKVSTEDMRTMQMDSRNEIAVKLTPLLLKVDIEDPDVRDGQQLLEGWDYTQSPDSAAAAYFNAVWRNILKLAFGDKLPKELRVEGDCISVEPADKTGPVDDPDARVRECGQRDPDAAQPDGGDRWFEVVRRLVDDEDSQWWHTDATRTDPATKTRDQLFARAMEDARWELTAELGKDMDTWSWGRLHTLELKNQTIGTEGPGFMQWLLNRGPYELGGGEAAVDATGWNAAGGYSVIWVPSMRMVVSLADFDKSKWVNLTGASGHAYSPNYTDQTEKWVNGELYDWAYGDEAVEEATENHLVLKP